MRNFLISCVVLLSPFALANNAQAGGIQEVVCASCSSASDFYNYGAGYIFENHGGAFAPLTNNDRVTVSNSNRSVRYTIDVDLVSNSVCLVWCFSYDQRNQWTIKYQKHGGPPSRPVTTFLNVLRENFKELQRQQNDAIDREKEVKEDDNGNIGEGSSAGRGGYVGQGFDWTGLSLDRFTNTRTGAVYNQFAYRGRIDRGLTLGHRTAIVRDTETNPRTGETYENEYRTDYLCGQRSYKCSANVKQK